MGGWGGGSCVLTPKIGWYDIWTDPSCVFCRPILSLMMPLNLVTDHTSEAKNQMQVFLYFNHRKIRKRLFNDNPSARRRKLRNMKSQKSTILTCIGVVTLYLTVMLPNSTINCNLIDRLPHTPNTVFVVLFTDSVIFPSSECCCCVSLGPKIR